jgi:hypothetical protein
MASNVGMVTQTACNHFVRIGTSFSYRGVASSRCARHSPALLSAGIARVSARLTVIQLVLAAFSATGLADFRAHAANIVDEAGPAAHEAGRLPTNGGAVLIQADAFRHLAHVLFTQTSVGAVLTLLSASHAGFDT